MSKKGMEILSCSSYLPSFSFQDFEFCEHCVYGKRTQIPHRQRGNVKDQRLTLAHSDLCGSMPILSLGGASYFATFIYNYSQIFWVFFLKHRDEVLLICKKFVTLVEN